MSRPLSTSLIFDLDGTVLDSLSGVEHSLRAAFELCGYPLRTTDMRRLIGPPIRKILAVAGDLHEPSALDALEAAFRASYDQEGWRRTVCFQEADAVLRAIRSMGHRLFVASNKPRHIALRILENQNLLELFEEIVTADTRIPAYSSKKEILPELLVRNAIDAGDCVFVGDTIEDAEAAASTGIGFVYMEHGYGEISLDSPVPVTLRLAGFAGFIPLLKQESSAHDR